MLPNRNCVRCAQRTRRIFYVDNSNGQIDEDLKLRLESLAKATQRSKSFLASKAIEDFLELNEWQVQEIQRGICEADQEMFAPQSQVAAIRKKWGA